MSLNIYKSSSPSPLKGTTLIVVCLTTLAPTSPSNKSRIPTASRQPWKPSSARCRSARVFPKSGPHAYFGLEVLDSGRGVPRGWATWDYDASGTVREAWVSVCVLAAEIACHKGSLHIPRSFNIFKRGNADHSTSCAQYRVRNATSSQHL